jgi:hypothetical protein
MQSERVMFEIYRETDFDRRFRVIYYTELSEHNRETEINRAMAGEHVFDGFLRNWRKDEAKKVIADYVAALNDGRPIDNESLAQRLAEHLG